MSLSGYLSDGDSKEGAVRRERARSGELHPLLAGSNDQDNEEYFADVAAGLGGGGSYGSVALGAGLGGGPAAIPGDKRKKSGDSERKMQAQALSAATHEEKYCAIIQLLVSEYYDERNKSEIKISSREEEKIVSKLLDTATAAGVTADSITISLVSAATELRRIANDTARAQLGWKNYCLSFFCCAPTLPVPQYTDSSLYKLIDAALKKAYKKKLITEIINLEKASDPMPAGSRSRRI